MAHPLERHINRAITDVRLNLRQFDTYAIQLQRLKYELERLDVDTTESLCDNAIHFAGLVKADMQRIRQLREDLRQEQSIKPDDRPLPALKTHQPTPDYYYE
jgi:hypothetical protein